MKSRPGNWAAPALFWSGSQWFASACRPCLWPWSNNTSRTKTNNPKHISLHIYISKHFVIDNPKPKPEIRTGTFWAYCIYCLTNSNSHFQLVHILTESEGHSRHCPNLLSVPPFLGSYRVMFIHFKSILYPHIPSYRRTVGALNSLTGRNWEFSHDVFPWWCIHVHSHGLLVLIDCYQPSWSHGRYHVVQEVVAFTQNSVPDKAADWQNALWEKDIWRTSSCI